MPQAGRLRRAEMDSLMVSGLEVWDQVVGRAGSLCRLWGPVHPMLLSWLLVAACSSWLIDSPLQSLILSSLLCFFSLCLSSLNLGWSHLDSLNLITSTKTIFPNQVEFTGTGGLGLSLKFLGTTIHLYGCENWTIKKAEHRRIDFLNCGVGEDSWESLGLPGDPTSPS